MNTHSHKDQPTTLTDDHFAACLKIVVSYLAMNQRIRNRDVRRIAGIGYDQAIHFFNRAISENRLSRQGSGSGTYYVLHQTRGQKRVCK